MWSLIQESIGNYIETELQPLASPEQVSKDVCPHAIGLMCGGVVFPPPHVLSGNSFSAEYCNRMTYVPNLGVNFWLKLASKAYRRNVSLNQLIETYSPQALNKVFPLLIYQPHPESFEIRLCSIHELILHHKIETVLDLLAYLVTFIAFGVYIDEYITTYVLKLENPAGFVAARLFQGKLDTRLSMNGVTAFVPFQSFSVQDTDIYNAEPIMQDVISKTDEGVDPSEIKWLIMNQENVAANATFVDNGTDMWKAINENNMSTLPSHYSRYLAHDSPLRKVGYRHFADITEGRSSKIVGSAGKSDYHQALENEWRKNRMKVESKLKMQEKKISYLEKELRGGRSKVLFAP